MDASSGLPQGWRYGDKQGDFNKYLVPDDPAIAGARLILEEASSNDLKDVLIRALAFDGFSTIEVTAEAAV